MMMTLISSAEQTTASVVDDAPTESLNYVLPLCVSTCVSPFFPSVYVSAWPLRLNTGHLSRSLASDLV